MRRGSGRTIAKVDAEDVAFGVSYMGWIWGETSRLNICPWGSLHEMKVPSQDTELSLRWGVTVEKQRGP